MYLSSNECGNNLILTKTNAREFQESTCARFSERKDSSYWWNLSIPLHAGNVAEHQNNQSIQYTHTEEIQVINPRTELLITIFWDHISTTHVDFLPSVTTVNANRVAYFLLKKQVAEFTCNIYCKKEYFARFVHQQPCPRGNSS